MKGASPNSCREAPSSSCSGGLQAASCNSPQLSIRRGCESRATEGSRGISLCTPLTSSAQSQLPTSRPKSFAMRSSAESLRNPFRMRSSKNGACNSFRMRSYKKRWGWGRYFSTGLSERQRGKVYVSSGEDYTNSGRTPVRSPRQFQFPNAARSEQRGHSNRGGWLDDDFHAFPDRSHRRDDLFFRSEQDSIGGIAQDCERPRRQRRAQAVGNRVALLERLQRPGGQRAIRVVRALGLAAENAYSREQAPRRKRRSAQQSATADRGEDRVEVWDVFQQLLGCRGLAGDDPVVVKGWIMTAPVSRKIFSAASWRAETRGSQKVIFPPYPSTARHFTAGAVFGMTIHPRVPRPPAPPPSAAARVPLRWGTTPPPAPSSLPQNTPVLAPPN